MATAKEIDLLRTPKQKYKKRRYNDMYIEREVIFSDAFRKLSGTAIRVYLLFLNKRVMKPYQGSKQKRSGKGKYYIENNGEIQFTYQEAEQKHSIGTGAFRTAIDRLIEVGLIDIARIGSSIFRDKTLYGISERWKLYGTDEFIEAKRPRTRQLQGFSKGNKLGANAI